MPACRAPSCTETRLCRAHVVPAGFARTLSDPGGHNRAIRETGSKPATQPHGEFDPELLCGPCDERLGRLDEYAIRFCASLPQTGRARTGQVFRHASFDGDTFARAMLAILWRASACARNQFAGIGLGPYADRVASVIFDGAPLASLPEVDVVLHRYASDDHDARRFVFMPLRIRSGALNAFTLGLGGFLVWAKFDRRPTDPILAPFIINAATELLAPTVRFEEMAEYAYFRQAASVERARAEAKRDR